MMKKIAENFNRLSRAHQRYKRQTDDRQTDGSAIAYSEREREFTSAKNDLEGDSRSSKLPLVDRPYITRYDWGNLKKKLVT